MRNKTLVGRPRRRDPRDITWPVKLSEKDIIALKNRKEETGVPVATQIYKAVEKYLTDQAEITHPPNVPLLGEILGGSGANVVHVLPSQYINSPFENLPEDCYALAVRDSNMGGELGVTNINGFYALFAPNVVLPHAIVHVEFDDNKYQHQSMLKRYVPKGNGVSELRPLNTKNKPIVLKDEEFRINGGFIKAWDGLSEK